MLTEKQQELLRKQLKAKTAPRIIAGMLGSNTMQGLKDNEKIVADFANKEGLPYNDSIQGDRKYGS